MTTDFICHALRTPFGRYGGSMSSVRLGTLFAVPPALHRAAVSALRANAAAEAA